MVVLASSPIPRTLRPELRVGKERRAALPFYDQLFSRVTPTERALIERGGGTPTDLAAGEIAPMDPKDGQGAPLDLTGNDVAPAADERRERRSRDRYGRDRRERGGRGR